MCNFVSQSHNSQLILMKIGSYEFANYDHSVAILLRLSSLASVERTCRAAGVEPVSYEARMKDSWLWTELHKTRNIRPSFNTRLGLYGGLVYSGVIWWALQGHEPWTFQHHGGKQRGSYGAVNTWDVLRISFSEFKAL